MNLKKKLQYTGCMLALLFFLLSCHNNGMKLGQTAGSTTAATDLASDTIKWGTQAILKKDTNCDSTASKSCVIVDIRYPVFQGHPVLNDSIEHSLMSIVITERRDTSLKQQVDNFMKDYEAFKKEPYAKGRQYELQASCKVLRQTPKLITVEINGYGYTGGAHGMSLTWYINYDRTNRKELKLEDVLKEGYTDSLTRVAERIFKRDEGLPAGKPLPANQYFFKDNKFSINDNYVFTPRGIQFLYNPYDIKPYAAGKTTLLVPYSEIKGLIKQGAIIP